MQHRRKSTPPYGPPGSSFKIGYGSRSHKLQAYDPATISAHHQQLPSRPPLRSSRWCRATSRVARMDLLAMHQAEDRYDPATSCDYRNECTRKVECTFRPLSLPGVRFSCTATALGYAIVVEIQLRWARRRGTRSIAALLLCMLLQPLVTYSSLGTPNTQYGLLGCLCTVISRCIRVM